VTLFGDVMAITSLKWRHNWFLKLDFVIISLKNHNLTKLRNFSSPKLKIKGRWGRKALALNNKILCCINKILISVPRMLRNILQCWSTFKYRYLSL